MLKLIYKTILVSIISCVLMVGELSSFADSRGTLTRNSDGAYQRTNTYDMKATNKEPAMAIIAMLAIAFLGSRLLTYEKWTTDMSVAAASSGIYIAGEIYNLINAKKDMKALEVQATIRSDGAVDSKQVEYIKTLRESYEKQIKYLKTKKMLQMGAMAGFLVAAGVATYQRFTRDGQHASCEASMATAIAGLKSCVATNKAAAAAPGAAPVVAANLTACSECLIRVVNLEKDVKILQTSAEVPGPSALKQAKDAPIDAKALAIAGTPCTLVAAPIFAPVNSSCSTFLSRKEIDEGWGLLKKTTSANELLQKLLYPVMPMYSYVKPEVSSPIKIQLKKALSFIFPEAKAGVLSMLGLAGGALLAFYAVELGIGQYVDDYLYTPGARILIWLGFAGIATVAINITKDKIGEAEDNIKKLDKILAETAKLQKGVKSSLAKINSVQLNLDQLYSTDEVISTTDKTGCLSSGVNSAQCQSLTSMNANNIGLQNLPEGLQNMVNTTTKVGDGVSNTGTLSASTLNQANALGSKSGALSKFLKKQQDSINDMLKKQGKGVIDFDLESRKVQSQMLGITSGALKNKGQSPEGFLASFGMSAPSNTSDKNAVVEKDKLANTKKVVTETGTATTKTEEKKETFDFSEKKEEELTANSQAVLANGMREGSSNDRYDMKGNDISKDNGSSIFDIITIRYLKSGYPKLLDEVK